MSLENFYGEFKTPQKTLRILVYPNITYAKDLEKDSYIQVIYSMITELNKIRDDLFFYLVMPKHMVMFKEFSNVYQFIIHLPSYPQNMRIHFDVKDWNLIRHRKWDFDLIFSHLPEHTLNIKNVLYNTSSHNPPVVGYCHWFDIKDVVVSTMHALTYNLMGLLEMKRCYLNTQAQKDLVLEEAGKILSIWNCKKLDEILEVQHPGIREVDIIEIEDIQPYEKIIVFNHRPATYKDFDNFMKTMDLLWEQRQDFKVWIPLLEVSNRPYVYVTKYDKDGYYKELQRCCVGYSPKQSYGGWSVASTDGIMRGVPYIMYDAPYYKELNPKANFFEDNDDAIQLLNEYLDNESHRNSMAKDGLIHLKKHLIYTIEMQKMLTYFDDVISEEKSITDRSNRFTEMVERVKTEKIISKYKLTEWMSNDRPYGMALNPYRRALMNHPNISDSDGSEPHYMWNSNMGLK
jgi:glycosyltransferase involved in cell wall biosynthesis